MKLLCDIFVAISNARLALMVKDIESTWTNLVAIFAGIPRMVRVRKKSLRIAVTVVLLHEDTFMH